MVKLFWKRFYIEIFRSTSYLSPILAKNSQLGFIQVLKYITLIMIQGTQDRPFCRKCGKCQKKLSFFERFQQLAQYELTQLVELGPVFCLYNVARATTINLIPSETVLECIYLTLTGTRIFQFSLFQGGIHLAFLASLPEV